MYHNTSFCLAPQRKLRHNNKIGLPKKEKSLSSAVPKLAINNYFLSLFSHAWLAIPQLVLQADWQDVWHSPQPPFFALSQRLPVLRVLMCSIILTSEKLFMKRLYHINFPKSTQFSKRNNQKYIDFIRKI